MSGYLAWTVPRACPHPSPPPEGEGAKPRSGQHRVPFPRMAPSPSGGGLGWGHAQHRPEFNTLSNTRHTSAHLPRTFTPVHPRSTEPQDFP
jgi:hypothetical protein